MKMQTSVSGKGVTEPLLVVSGLDSGRSFDKQGDFLSVVKTFLAVRVKDAVSFCPMFCILFLGALVRARQLGNGHPDASPQPWCMKVEFVATATIIVLTIARVDAILPPHWYMLANACSMLQYLCLSVLYCSAIAVVVALFIMTPESALDSGQTHHGQYGDSQRPAVTPGTVDI